MVFEFAEQANNRREADGVGCPDGKITMELESTLVGHVYDDTFIALKIASALLHVQHD